MRAGVAPEVQTELVGLMTSDPEAGKQRRMVEIAAEKSLTLTTEDVRGFLLQMDDLGVRRHRAGCCCLRCRRWWLTKQRQLTKEAHDEPTVGSLSVLVSQSLDDQSL